jgi:hypothetical protein
MLKYYLIILGMLLWFVEDVMFKAFDGVLIEESCVEVDPNNLCSGVADDNVCLEMIQEFLQMMHGDVC